MGTTRDSPGRPAHSHKRERYSIREGSSQQPVPPFRARPNPFFSARSVHHAQLRLGAARLCLLALLTPSISLPTSDPDLKLPSLSGPVAPSACFMFGSRPRAHTYGGSARSRTKPSRSPRRDGDSLWVRSPRCNPRTNPVLRRGAAGNGRRALRRIRRRRGTLRRTTRRRVVSPGLPPVLVGALLEQLGSRKHG